MKLTVAESDVLAACLALLRLRGIPHWRANTGGAWLTGKQGKPRPVRFGVPGCSDILGIVPGSGRLLAVECKRPGGRLSDAQAAFLGVVRANQGVAAVISDVRQLSDLCDRLGVDPWTPSAY